MEDTFLEVEAGINWDWWGSSTSSSIQYIRHLCNVRLSTAANGEAEDKTTKVGGIRSRALSPTPVPLPITAPINSRYHPCKGPLPLMYMYYLNVCLTQCPPDRFTAPRTREFRSQTTPFKNSSRQLNTRKACSNQISRQVTPAMSRFRLLPALRASLLTASNTIAASTVIACNLDPDGICRGESMARFAQCTGNEAFSSWQMGGSWDSIYRRVRICSRRMA